MTGAPLRRASSALLLLGLLAVLVVVPAHVALASAERAGAAGVLAIGGEDDTTPLVRTAGAARRLSLQVIAAGAPDLAPPLARLVVRRDSVLRTSGRQFDARVAQRAPPSS